MSSIGEYSSWPDNVYIGAESQEREDVWSCCALSRYTKHTTLYNDSSEIRYPRILEKKKKTQLNLW